VSVRDLVLQLQIMISAVTFWSNVSCVQLFLHQKFTDFNTNMQQTWKIMINHSKCQNSRFPWICDFWHNSSNEQIKLEQNRQVNTVVFYGTNGKYQRWKYSSNARERISYHEWRLLNSIEQFVDRYRETQSLTDAHITFYVVFLWCQRCAVQHRLEILSSQVKVTVNIVPHSNVNCTRPELIPVLGNQPVGISHKFKQ